MKIRMDFVTNSSSTGYVVVTLKTNKGIGKASEEYDTGYGGWIWNHRSVGSVLEDLDKVSSGKDLRKVLSDSVESFNYFAKGKNSNILAVLDEVKERDELIELVLEEGTHFDDGKPYHFHLKYDFEQSKAIELEDGYYNEHAGDYEYVKRAISNLTDEELLDLNTNYFEGSEFDVMPMEVFNEWYSEDEREEIINQIKENGKHFDSEEKYISFINGSANNGKTLIDINALIEEVANDEDGCDLL